jgi:hypothetical protein
MQFIGDIMKHVRTIVSLVLVLTALLAPSMTAQAFPALPSSFYGEVSYNGENVPDGTVVEALINGQVIAQGLSQTYEGKSVYSLDVNGDDSETSEKEGGIEGDEIRFRVGGLDTGQIGTWHSGTNVELNLTVTSTAALNSPQSTPAPLATQTTIGYAPTETIMPITVTSSMAKKQGATGILAGAVAAVALSAAGFVLLKRRKKQE